jgi:hypothetical protein
MSSREVARTGPGPTGLSFPPPPARFSDDSFLAVLIMGLALRGPPTPPSMSNDVELALGLLRNLLSFWNGAFPTIARGLKIFGVCLVFTFGEGGAPIGLTRNGEEADCVRDRWRTSWSGWWSDLVLVIGMSGTCGALGTRCWYMFLQDNVWIPSTGLG